MPQLLAALLVLFLVAAVISLVISFVVSVVAGALSLLPVVFVVVAIWFFVKGGKIHVEFPGRNDRNRLN